LNIQTKTKIRLVVLGGVLSSIPLVFVILLPGVLLRHHYLSINYAFLLLGVVPITYGYAIFRHHLLDIERHVNRGVTYLLVFSILGSAYLILFALALRGWLPHPLAENPFLNALIMLILASTFVPLRRRIQKIVDSAFYGGWYDYRSAVSRILQGIERITELQILANTICQRLCDILHLENAYAFLSDTSGHLSVASAAYSNHQHVQLLPELTLSNDSPLPQYLKGMGKPIAETVLRADLSTAALSDGEKLLLDHSNGRLYLGIISHDELFGILGLGAKIGGDIFNYEDLDILRIVAQQMGPLIQNIHLLTRLKQHAAELEKHVAQRTAELHAEKDRAEAILSSVGEGVIVTDLHGDILTVNHEFEFQTGYTADEAIGNSLFSLMGSDEPQSRGIPASILQVLEKGGIWRGERLHKRKDSNPYHVHLTIAPIHARSGQVIGYVASQRDITEYKKFDRLKDQFILEISHQLRTPLTNISLLTDLLERGKAHKREDYMLMLKAEIGQLVVMIEQVLELSRLEIGKYRKEDFGRLDVNLVTDQAISAYHSIAQASGLQLIFERGENIPPLWGGPQLLDRMVEGLISNAINFTPSGAVHIRTYKCENQVCLEIQDTGLGIDPADLPHLFDRFYRGRNVDRSRQKGAGLGLCIVREIVNIHNGRIEVESEKDKGTTFRIWLPAMNASRDLSASIKV
jgi:PAS domain S-box-containing protein